MAQVHLPTALGALVPGLPKRAEVDSGTVSEVIAQLNARWPGVAACLCASREALRPHINVYVDGRRAEMTTPVNAASVVRVLTAVSGG